MITLTREEAQQVTDRELIAQAIVALEYHTYQTRPIPNTNLAIEALRARLAQPEPDYRDVVIAGDLWRIEFLPDHAASVVLVKANYEAKLKAKNAP